MWGRSKEKPKLTVIRAADRAEKLLAEMQIELAGYDTEVNFNERPQNRGT